MDAAYLKERRDKGKQEAIQAVSLREQTASRLSRNVKTNSMKIMMLICLLVLLDKAKYMSYLEVMI